MRFPSFIVGGLEPESLNFSPDGLSEVRIAATDAGLWKYLLQSGPDGCLEITHKRSDIWLPGQRVY